MEQEKYNVYMARASHAEEQAAKTRDAGTKMALLRVAKEYREAARDAKRQLPKGNTA